MKRFWERYSVLIIFGLIFAFGLTIRYATGTYNGFWDFWASLDVAFAVALGVMAFLAYKDYIKSEDKVTIYFNVDNELKNTHLSLLRKDCTRGEILGVLGMIQRKNNERFSLSPKDLAPLLKEVQDVQKGKKDNFVINMTSQEFEQFIIYNPNN